MGYDLAVDAIALLEAHHGLFSQLMNKFVGPPRLGPTTAGQAPDERPGRGWLDAMDAEAFVDAQLLQGPQGQPAAPEGEQQVEAGAVEQNGDYWAEFNRRKKLDVQTWYGANPGRRLLLLKELLAIMLGLMAHFLYVGSKRWEEKQMLKAARGQTRKFLVVEAALGRPVADAMTRLKNLVQRPMQAIPFSEVGAALASLRFRLSSAALTAMHVLIRTPRTNPPYSVFALLAPEEQARVDAQNKLCSTPRCMWDQLYTLLRSKFPEDQELLQTDCQAVLLALAAVYAVDISAIESRHASTREFTTLRSRGWVPNLEAVGSKFVTQRYANAPSQTERQASASDGAPAKARRGGGGAWRAFVADVSSGSQIKDFRSLGEQYRALSDAERAHYQEAGAAGTVAHKAGFPSFGPRDRRPKGIVPPRALPGTVTETGALVALDTEREWQVAPYTGPTFEDALEEYALQLNRALGTDALTKQEGQELLSFQQEVPQNIDMLTALQPHSELATGLARDVFAKDSTASAGINMTGFSWLPPTAALVEACILQGLS